MGKTSFDALSVTNILDTAFVMEYTDPTSPLDKIEVSLEAGETKNFAMLIGTTIATDIATTYCVSQGERHYGKDFQSAYAKVVGETPVAPVVPAKKQAPVAPVAITVPETDETEEEGEDLDPETTEEESAPEAPVVPAKAKTKR